MTVALGTQRRTSVPSWLASAVVVLAACSSNVDCDAAGCWNGVSVRPPAGVDDAPLGVLRVCIEDDCRVTAFRKGVLADERGEHEVVTDAMVEWQTRPEVGRAVTAVLEMPDGRRFRAEATTASLRPNGPRCGPVCTHAMLELQPG